MNIQEVNTGSTVRLARDAAPDRRSLELRLAAADLPQLNADPPLDGLVRFDPSTNSIHRGARTSGLFHGSSAGRHVLMKLFPADPNDAAHFSKVRDTLIIHDHLSGLQLAPRVHCVADAAGFAALADEHSALHGQKASGAVVVDFVDDASLLKFMTASKLLLLYLNDPVARARAATQLDRLIAVLESHRIAAWDPNLFFSTTGDVTAIDMDFYRYYAGDGREFGGARDAAGAVPRKSAAEIDDAMQKSLAQLQEFRGHLELR